jgi:uncharacterized protein DUF547
VKFLGSVVFLVFGFLAAVETVVAAESEVPEPFQRFDSSSTNAINYDVLTQWLDYMVVDIGRSDRRSANSGRAQIYPTTGTRIAPKVKKQTLFEGNRFFFESFEGNAEAKRVLADVRDSLEQIPSITPLEYFSRDEQLAYWLNLYNITILNEIVAIYPTRNLKEFLVGENSILSKKLLTVTGIPLSLDDIQFTILKENYDGDPLILYGFYQGIIGGPNIRKHAFTGATVYRDLEDNAVEFINSNRGTNRANSNYKVRKVSSLYARGRSYFPDFNEDLSEHLSRYIEGGERGLVDAKTTLKPVLDDWTVTDIWGTFPEVRTGIASNPAALMDAIVSTTPGDPATGGGTVGASLDSGSTSGYMRKAGKMRGANNRPELFQYLLLLNMKRLKTNEQKATVTIEDLVDSPSASGATRKKNDN